MKFKETNMKTIFIILAFLMVCSAAFAQQHRPYKYYTPNTRFYGYQYNRNYYGPLYHSQIHPFYQYNYKGDVRPYMPLVPNFYYNQAPNQDENRFEFYWGT